MWAEAVNTAVYIINRAPAAGIGNNTTPFEIWTGRKPNLDHLRIFGSPVMVHIPKERRKKWDKKRRKYSWRFIRGNNNWVFNYNKNITNPCDYEVRIYLTPYHPVGNQRRL